ncbi:MAG: S8 family serine peptidase [Candidatus Natronoplasma sp.]
MRTKSTPYVIAVLLLAIFLVSGTAASGIGLIVERQYEDTEDKTILVYNEDSSELNELEKTGEVLDRYGRNILMSISETEIDLVERKYEVNHLENSNNLHVKGYEFNTNDGIQELDLDTTIEDYEDGTEGLYLIDMIAPINPEWREELEDAGVGIINYVNNYAYEVSMTPEQAEEIEELFFVDWVGVYQPSFKVPEDIEFGLMNVILRPGTPTETIEALQSEVSIKTMEPMGEKGHNLIVDVQSKDEIKKLTLNQDVYHISEYVEPELHGEIASQITGGGCWIWDPDEDPYEPYRGNGDHGAYVNQLGYTGDGVIVTVADTGIYPDHADFQDRVIGGYGFGEDEDYWEDGYHHGTFVTGNVAGNTYEGSNITIDEFDDIVQMGPYYVNQGLAYDSELYAAKIFSDGGAFIGPTDLFEIAEIPAQKTDTYIHTNSWGSAVDGNYSSGASAFDEAVRDANRETEANRPMVITTSAGNEGPGYNTVGDPGTAKNTITVGSTENFMPDSIGSLGGIENPYNVSDFSSRGWSNDNRVKPDVVAPGESIFSSGNEHEEQYSMASGTSFSNPNVAGAAAVVVEWYEEKYGIRPSPAMVRALLINTAHPLDEDEGNTGPIPNRDEGWGMVNLPDLIDAESEFLLDDQTSLMTTGDVQEYEIPYDNIENDEPLKITLTWTDKEASIGDEQTLKNDLDLEVESPNGDIYTGNAFPVDEDGYSNSSFTEPNSNAMPDFDLNEDGTDDANNIENVYIHPDDLESGDYTVRVIGENVPADANNDGEANQDYALVKYPSPYELPSAEITHPQGGERWPKGEEINITWHTEKGYYDIKEIDLHYTLDGGSSWDTIEEGITDDGKYTWELPKKRTLDAKVRVTLYDEENLTNFRVSGSFAILGEPPTAPENLTVEHYMDEITFYDPVHEDKGYLTGETEGASTWEIRDHNASVGEKSWDFGDEEYNKGGDMSWLISPEINLTKAETAELRFDHWRSFTGMRDGGNLKISTEGVEDGSWELIEPEEEYDGEIEEGRGNPLEGEKAWGYYSDWEQVTFDLDDYAGETIHLNWTASTEDWDHDHGEGWRIDNITVDIAGRIDDGDHNLLTWEPSPDDSAGLDTVVGYDIYRSESLEGPWNETTMIASIEADGSADYRLVDYEKGGVDDEYWWYMIKARDWQHQSVGDEDEIYQEPGDPEPTVRVTDPEYDEVLAINDVTARWTGFGLIDYYQIKVSEEDWIEVNKTEYEFTDLEDGLHTIEVEAVGTEGYTDLDNISFKVDTTPPTLNIMKPEEEDALATENVTVEWEGHDEVSGIDHYEVRLEDEDWIGVGIDTEYTFEELSEGEHTVEIRATDLAGHNTVEQVTFTVDTTPPDLEIKEPEEGELFDVDEVTVEWEGHDEVSGIDYYEVRIDDDWIDVGMDTEYTFEDMPGGEHTVEVRATDMAGHNTVEQVTFTVDTTPPDLEIKEPEEGELFDVDEVTVEWEGHDEVSGIDYYEVRIDDDWIDVGMDTEYTFEDMPGGEHTVEVRATDMAGHNTVEQVTFTVISTYELSIDIEGEGTVIVEYENEEVEVEDEWSEDIEEGIEVTLTAVPDDNWEFDGWTGTDETGDEITIKIDDDKEVIAVFEEEEEEVPGVTVISWIIGVLLAVTVYYKKKR